MDSSTLTAKGQFTIPVALRKLLELHTGDKLNCYIEDDKLIVVPAKGSVKNVRGMFGKAKKVASLEEIDEAIAQEAASSMGDL